MLNDSTSNLPSSRIISFDAHFTCSKEEFASSLAGNIYGTQLVCTITPLNFKIMVIEETIAQRLFEQVVGTCLSVETFEERNSNQYP